MEYALEVDHVAVHFGDLKVLADLSFNVAKGTSLAVIGPNGAGKTVLFQALIGSLSFAGNIQWAPDVRIGYVPQRLDIERDVPITGADFLRARASLTGGAETEIPRVLELAGISKEVSRSPIGTLSGG